MIWNALALIVATARSVVRTIADSRFPAPKKQNSYPKIAVF
jgi:hypothetical protein